MQKPLLIALVITAIIAAALTIGQIWFDIITWENFVKAISTLAVLAVLIGFLMAVKADFGAHNKLKDENYLDSIMTKGPAKGQKTPLAHTLKSQQRVIATLNWHPRDKVGIIDHLTGKNKQYDLDILCFVFDKKGEYADFVGGMMQDAMSQSGHIYHSGDDMTGEGNIDDEFVTTELAELPEDLQDLVFIVEIRSNHTFQEIESVARIVDGFSHTTLLEADIGLAEGQSNTAYVFARLSRDPASPTGWMLHHIGEYPDISKITDWGDYLKKHLA